MTLAASRGLHGGWGGGVSKRGLKKGEGGWGRGRVKKWGGVRGDKIYLKNKKGGSGGGGGGAGRNGGRRGDQRGRGREERGQQPHRYLHLLCLFTHA